MPPKKKRSCKQGATPSEECCIYCQPVTLGKDEALFCVGSCQQGLHRYCASVSAQRYQAITGDSSPFLCPNCCCEQQKEQIAVLTNSVESLRHEITQLKESLVSVSGAQTAMAETSKRSYATATKSSVSRCHAYNRSSKHSARTLSSTSSPTTLDTNGESVPPVPSDPPTMSKVKVAGARRIWGTLRDCTIKSVKNVIARVCKIDSGVHVKRKVKENPTSKKTRWWFVLHATEDLLCDLEGKWAEVNLQTSWKLEPCFKPFETDSQSAENLSHLLNPSLDSHAPCIRDNDKETAVNPAAGITKPNDNANETVANSAAGLTEPNDNAQCPIPSPSSGTLLPTQHSQSSHPDHSNSPPLTSSSSTSFLGVTTRAMASPAQ